MSPRPQPEQHPPPVQWLRLRYARRGRARSNSSPTGAASEAEYVEIGLAVASDPEVVRVSLDTALPIGLDMVAAEVAPRNALADLLTGSRWQIDLPGVVPEVVERAVAAFLVREVVEVSRMTKSGLRTFDARSAVHDLRYREGRLIVTIVHQVPLVRPDDLLAGLSAVEPECRLARPPLVTRLSQGTLDHDTGEIAPLL